MFFQTPTPDTSEYMIAGYAIAFIVMALYVASMALRSRNLKQDLTTLEEMDKTTQEKPRKGTLNAASKKASN
jgi:uncharacterized protein with FMN-binding domain